MKTTLSLCALTALALPLTAQEPVAVATNSPLVMKTSSNELAEDLLAKFGDGATSLESGQMLVMTLDDGGRPQVRVEQGDAGMIQVQAQPARLMEVYAEKINEFRQMAQGMGTFMLSQQGMQAKDAIKVIQGVFDFPTQIESATLVIKGDPKSPQDGFDGDLALTPVEGTWFGRFVTAMQPKSNGAPKLAQSSSMMDAALAIEMKDAGDLLEPLLAVFAAQGSKTEEERVKHQEYMQTSFDAGDGTFGMSWDPVNGGMQIVAGLKDAAAVKKMWADPDYQRWTEEQSKTNPAVEVESDFNAFDHRGVSVAKTTILMDDNGMPNPMFKDGRAENYVGVTDNYIVMTMFGEGEAGIKQLIDTAVDGKVARKPLGSNVLATMTMKLAEFADHMSDGMANSEEMPEKIDLALGRKGSSLTLKFHAK